MRRKRFQRGSLKTRKRNGKNYWYAQWREEGETKIERNLGLCSKMSRISAEGMLKEILKPINEEAEKPREDQVDVREVLSRSFTFRSVIGSGRRQPDMVEIESVGGASGYEPWQ